MNNAVLNPENKHFLSEEEADAILSVHKDEILRKVKCSSAVANQSQADGVSTGPDLNCTCCV